MRIYAHQSPQPAIHFSALRHSEHAPQPFEVQERFHLEGPFGTVSNLVMTHQGKFVAAISKGNIYEQKPLIRVLQLDRHHELYRTYLPCDSSARISLSPDAKHLLINTGTKLLLDDVTCKKMIALNGKGTITAEFSPNGRILALGQDDGQIKLLDPENGRLLKSFQAHTGPVTSIAFTSDGSAMATGGRDETIHEWNPETLQLVRTFQGHQESVTKLLYSPDGNTLVSGSDDAAIHIWNRFRPESVQVIKSHYGPISAMAIAPNGQYLVSASSWDDSYKPNGFAIYPFSFPLLIHDLKTGKQLHRFQNDHQPTSSITISPNSRTIMTGTEGSRSRLTVWDLKRLE